MHPPGYPIVLPLEGHPCVVVGGGRVAHGKVSGLLRAGAHVTVIAPEIRDDIVDLDVAVIRRPYRAGDLSGARVAIAATGDRAVDRAVYADGEAEGILVNVADDPGYCGFTLPAVVRRGPITVAVSSGGLSPALSTWLRDRIAGALPAQLDALAALIGEARATVRQAGVRTDGLAWHDLIGAVGDALDHDPARARALLDAFIDAATRAPVDDEADLGGTVN